MIEPAKPVDHFAEDHSGNHSGDVQATVASMQPIVLLRVWVIQKPFGMNLNETFHVTL